MAFADHVRTKGERAHVVLLAREKELVPVEDWLGRCLVSDVSVTFSRLSWEQIYRALIDVPELHALRCYFERKSYSLRPAFKLGALSEQR